jgi:hypothetical protein
MFRTTIACVACAAALGAAASTTASATESARPRPFGSCGELVSYARAHAGQIAGSGGIAMPPGVVAAPERLAGAPAAAPDFSTTNVQEAGVDEADIVKSDGSHIFAVAGNKLYALDARAARPRLLDSLPLPEGSRSELLVSNGRLLVLTGVAVLPQPLLGRPGLLPIVPTKTVLTEVDARDPASLKVVRTLTVDGSYLTARQVGAAARVVITSLPGIQPAAGGGAAKPTREAIASSGVGVWLPSAVLKDRRTGRTTTRALVQCRAVARPARFSGVGLVTILTIDLARGLPAVDSDALMMGGGTVYASADALYVASQSWFPLPLAGATQRRPTGITTEIDKFDTSQPDQTSYEASGSVPGSLLNQWSLSEYQGDLRVASTELPTWWNPSPQQQSESAVHVLSQRGDKLVEIGRVGGLGRGDRVYAVRFAGATGFVVTFRQVDPLYTLDLGDPTDPRVLGALELRGFSAYLHPIGGDRLLGVGQDATDEGRLLGTQLSLFDVSNLRRPARLDAAPLGPGSSEVEYDPHAFLYWPAKSLAVVPVQLASGQFEGALAVRVGRTGLAELGRITQDAPIRRTLVVGNRLFTVSDQGVKASDLDTLADRAWIPFS